VSQYLANSALPQSALWVIDAASNGIDVAITHTYADINGQVVSVVSLVPTHDQNCFCPWQEHFRETSPDVHDWEKAEIWDLMDYGGP